MKVARFVSIGFLLCLTASNFASQIVSASTIGNDWTKGLAAITKAASPYQKEQCMYETRQINVNARAFYKQEDYQP